MTEWQNVRYCFGELELDVDAYVLRRRGRALQLTPKVFDVLRYLVEHRGRVVSKQELLDAVWSGRQVSEVAVPWAISHARRAVGQRGREKRPIETVHRRGYRFVAEVKVRSGPGEPVAAPPSSAARAPGAGPLYTGANDAHLGALAQLVWVPPYAFDMRKSQDLSAHALSLARQIDHDGPLLQALHARLYALSGPDDTDALLETGDEIVRRDGSPPTWVSTDAWLARYGALVYRGDLAGAEAARAALGRIGRERNWTETLWTADRLAAQRKLLEGDFAAAEAARANLRARAQRLRLSYAIALTDVLETVLTALRDGPSAAIYSWPTSPEFPSIHDLMASIRPRLARLCFEVGQRESARSVLGSMVTQGGISELPKDIGYLRAVADLALLAIGLEDRPRAEQLYEALAPYPHHNTPDCMMFYEGSVSHFLGMLAAFLRRDRHAARHFDDALEMNQKLGLQPRLAQTYYAYARLLLGTKAASSRKSGLELKRGAIALADSLGMARLATHARSLGRR